MPELSFLTLTKPASALPTFRLLQGLKQLSDILIVLLFLPFWGPLCLLVALLIWLEDGKNPLFIQDRIGKDGKIFRVFKFRTMVVNSDEVLLQALEADQALRREWETFYKLRFDPRITRVGRFLRRSSLDELPQLLNVLLGDMALIGPRPLPAYHQQALPEQVRSLRESVKPGLTGLWQVCGRSDAGTEGMKSLDPYYVHNWSPSLDLVIFVRTIIVVLTGRGAY